MAWTGWPSTPNTAANAATDVHAYAWLIQLWRACRERSKVTNLSWPRANTVWETGTIESLTVNGDGTVTLADSTKNWVLVGDQTGAKWYNFNDPNASWLPGFYKVVIDGDQEAEPWKIISANIVGQPSVTSVKLAAHVLQNAVTANRIASVASLVGKSYRIIKQSNGLWWEDRWPNWPNDQEYERGGCDPIREVRDSAKAWVLNVFVGKTIELATDAGTQTATIIRNDAAAIYFNALNWLPTVGGAYRILDGGTELDAGTITARRVLAYVPGKSWADDQWAGKEIVVDSLEGITRRLTISRNVIDAVDVGDVTWRPGAYYGIVDTGKRCVPGRVPGAFYWWYSGARRLHWSTYPDYMPSDGTIRETLTPAPTVSWSSGDGETCEPITVDAFDKDVWSEIDEQCSAADDCKTPELPKTLRAIQLQVETLANAERFVDPTISYSGRKSIPYFTWPSLALKLGINAGSTTATGVAATAPGPINVARFTFTLEGLANQGVDYALVDPAKDDDNVQNSTSTTVNPDGTIVIDRTELDVGRSLKLIWTRGWTRKHPREFRYAYPRKGFIPDMVTDDVGVVDPPALIDFEEFGGQGVGAWLTRDKSITYKGHDQYGLVSDGDGDFVEGELARYSGDNWNDPGIIPRDLVDYDAFTRPAGYAVDTPYWARFFEGGFPTTPTDAQSLYEGLKRGIATGGNLRSLTDSAKTWWGGPMGAGQMIEHVRIATGGSTTTLVDTSIATDDFMRELGLSIGRWAGFTLEVTKTVGGQPFVYKTLITGYDSASKTFTFGEITGWTIDALGTTPAIVVPTLDVDSGDAYRIREPAYRLNWWKGRTLKMTKPDGTVITREIQGNDATTLFFSPLDEPVQAGWSYEIVELQIGAVYQWTGAGTGIGNTGWSAPTGEDPRGADFLPNLRANLPTIVTKYGRLMKGDYIAQHLFDELYRALNMLRWTRVSFSWTSREDPEVAELNVRSVTALSDGFGNYAIPAEDLAAFWDGAWDPVQDVLDAGFDGTGDTEDVDTPPRGEMQTNKTDNGDGGAFAFATATRAYAYPVISNTTQLACAASCYVYSTKLGTDPVDNPDDNTLEQYAFDTMGDSVIEDRFSEVATKSAGSETEWIGPKVGSTSIPPVYEPPDPTHSRIWDQDNGGEVPGHIYIQIRTAGYDITDQAAVLKWDVAGGFVFVD